MPEPPPPRFEEALDQIERIVADLERGEPSLNAALGKYEEGVRLLRDCYELLEQAERSVALLTGVDSQGTAETSPFDATATSADSGPTRSKSRERRSAAPPTTPGPSEIDDLPF